MKLTDQQREVVERNMGLVNVHIRRFVSLPRSPNRQREYDDLFQEGCLALMQASTTYDAERHGPFAAYAIPRIHHAISIALYERFSTVRVPAKSIKRARQRRQALPEAERHRPEPALADTHSLGDEALGGHASETARHRSSASTRRRGRAWSGDGPTFAHRLREKHRAAVRVAADRVSAGGRGREDRGALIQRFVEERLLIPEPDSQTPKRQLARDFNCSIGRVQSCEDALTAEIRSLLEADDEFQALLKLARRYDDGLDAVIDTATSAKVERAALDGFARQFASLPIDRQAEVLRDLACTTMGSLAGFARRLYGQLDGEGRSRLLGMVRPEPCKAGRRKRPNAARSKSTATSTTDSAVSRPSVVALRSSNSCE